MQGERENSLRTQMLQGSLREFELLTHLRLNGEYDDEHRGSRPEFRDFVVLVLRERVAGVP